MTMRKQTEGRRIVERHLPDVLHVRRPRKFREPGWMSIDVTHWKTKLARAIDRAMRKRTRHA